MSENITLSVDTSAGQEALAALEKRIDEIVNKENTVIQTTEKASKMSFNRVLSMARMGWSVTDQVMQAFGIHANEQVRLLIQSAFSSISFLTPILMAESVTPGMQLQAAFGLGELASAALALFQAQTGQQQLSRATAEASRALFQVGSFLGAASYM
jgi:uncharacterized membrane protein